jgi:alpha/beta superfamily hydrolase
MLLALVSALNGLTGCKNAPAAMRKPERVSLTTEDGWLVAGNLEGSGDHGLVLVHGGRLTKESWGPQTPDFVRAGFRVLAIDLRGFGESKGGLARPPQGGKQLDVLAAVRYLRSRGAKTVSVVGGSMGGDAAAGASVECAPGEIDRVAMIASGGIETPERMKGRKLFITCRDDLGSDGKPRLENIQRQYEKAPEPKKLVVLEGSAHAQFAFQTEQGEPLLREVLSFLQSP